VISLVHNTRLWHFLWGHTQQWQRNYCYDFLRQKMGFCNMVSHFSSLFWAMSATTCQNQNLPMGRWVPRKD